MAAQLRRRWQLDTLHAASRCAHLMPIVYEADLQTLAAAIGSVAELERLLEDRSGTDLGHVFDDAPAWMESTLTHVEALGTADAIDRIKLVRGRTRDHIGRNTIVLHGRRRVPRKALHAPSRRAPARARFDERWASNRPG